MTEPTAANNYQVGPTLAFNRERWNAVMLSIAQRLAAREALEATFEALVANGTQAALDLIQVNVGPQLETLTAQIAALEEQLEEILGGGTAANSLLLGGQLPAFYLALANATGTLPVTQVSGVDALIADAITALKSGVGTALDTLDELAAALGDDPNFATTIATALAARLRFDAAQTLSSGQIAQALTNLAINDRLSPVGSLVSVFGTTAPAGTIKANGALLSRATYVDLWAYAQGSGALVSEATWSASSWGSFSQGDGATTFRIPDLRGEFLRGWDNGRGVDSGRGIGTAQGDAIRNITGSTSPFYRQSLQAEPGVLRTAGYGSTPANPGTPGGAPGDSATISFDASLVVPTAAENRPRSVSILHCIKY